MSTWRSVGFVLLLAAATSGVRPNVAAAQDPFDAAQRKQIEAFERRILYHPRTYHAAKIAAFESRGGRAIAFDTDQGKQKAWLIPPTAGKCEKLWVMCGGNASTALDFEPLARELKFANDAFLLVDYPSYGACAGQPSPAAIRANIKAAIPAAAKIVKIDTADFATSILTFGHSLGCSAALMAVEEFKLRSAVLCAPFTSTREMAKEKFYIADEVPLAHLYDNRPGLKALAAAKGRAWIFHGDQDDVIPATMSKTLAAEFKDCVTLKMVARADHNDLIARDLEAWKKAMADARK